MLLLKNIEFGYSKGVGSFNISIDELIFKSSVITCVIGKNGSGKSTLLNLIGGHLFSKKGLISLFGNEITDLKAEQRPTSTVFQQIGLFPHLSIKENIELAIEPNTLFKKSAATKIKAKKVLNEFNLEELSIKKPNQLSIGQQQTVAIARALNSHPKPKVLLLDEPTSALDFSNISNLKKTILEIKEKEIVPIIIIVSHDLHFVLSIADEIKYIEDGIVIFQGTKEEFKSSKYFIN